MVTARDGAVGLPKRQVRHCRLKLSGTDWDASLCLLLQLRPTMDADIGRAFLEEALAGGYELGLLMESGESNPVALAGFRILPTSRGRILFLEDLVVSPEHRRSGAGGALLEWTRTVARGAACDRIELDTGITNDTAQSFYLEHGMKQIAIHFGMDLD